MNNNKKEIKVNLVLTDGWQERVAQASYGLYFRMKEINKEKPIIKNDGNTTQ